jgi:hypothetical protein
MLAGLVGAVSGGYALVLFDPSMRTAGLTTALAALAGALWLTGIVEVFSSRRRPGEDGEHRNAERESSPSGLSTPAYDATREALVGALLEDATAHDGGRYEDIGGEPPGVRTAALHGRVMSSRLQLALRFRHDWIEARNQRWQGNQGATPLALEEWPRFARVIASDLALDRDTTDPAIVGRFAGAAPLVTAASVAGARMGIASIEDPAAVGVGGG